MLAYRNAPPIPAQVVDAQGATLFSGDEISEGQTIFLKYGLMANGSIWGHGAYLGPDYSAEALHRMGENIAGAIAQQQYQQPFATLTRSQQAAVHGRAATDAQAAQKTKAVNWRSSIGSVMRSAFRPPLRDGWRK